MDQREPMPDVRAIPGNRYEVTCAWCLLPSAPVAATSPGDVWAALQRLGWTWRRGAYGGKGGPACPTCSAKTGDEGEAVKRAHRSRKKRKG